jgi:hypothetical protein
MNGREQELREAAAAAPKRPESDQASKPALRCRRRRSLGERGGRRTSARPQLRCLAVCAGSAPGGSCGAATIRPSPARETCAASSPGAASPESRRSPTTSSMPSSAGASRKCSCPWPGGTPHASSAAWATRRAASGRRAGTSHVRRARAPTVNSRYASGYARGVHFRAPPAHLNTEPCDFRSTMRP